MTGPARRVLVVGSAGQDGALLVDSLRRSGCEVAEVTRSGARASGETRPFDITDHAQVRELVGKFRPAEIYYLAAFHHSSEDVPPPDQDLLKTSMAVHFSGAVAFLDAIAHASPRTRFFYAASSHVFGADAPFLRDENAPLNPESLYGVSKAAGLLACRYYRARGIFAAGGILFPHESFLRKKTFVSKKIASSAAEAHAGKRASLVLGDLDAGADWGYAPDFIDAMQRILELGEPQDFVVATGEHHTVREFVEEAFKAVGRDYGDHVQVSSAIVRRRAMPCAGDSGKLRRLAGWAPSVSFREMVRRLVALEIESRSLRPVPLPGGNS